MADHEHDDDLVDYEEEEENVTSEKPAESDAKEVKKWVPKNTLVHMWHLEDILQRYVNVDITTRPCGCWFKLCF